MATKKTTKSAEPVVENTAINPIPTGSLPYEVVEKLPSAGAENTIYGVPINAEDEISPCRNYRYHKGEWQEVDLGVSVLGFLFADYQEQVSNIIADLETRIEALEGGGIVLIDEPVAQMQGAEVQFLASVPEDVYIEGGDTVKAEITGLTFDGLADPTNINASVEVDYGYIRFANHDAIVQFDEFGENKYIYLNVYNADGKAVSNPSCDNLKVTLIKGVAK